MDNLPDEILIKILSKLNTLDLTRFCSVFKRYDYFLKEKIIVRKVDVCRCFEIDGANIKKNIIDKLEHKYIRTLNIAGIYWMKANDLRTLISSLPNLSQLYAVDTKLSLSGKDVLHYCQLTKLSVMCDDDLLIVTDDPRLPIAYSLKSLYIKSVIRHPTDDHIVNFMRLCRDVFVNLEEIWICDTGGIPFRICFQSLINNVKSIKKITMRLNWPVPHTEDEYQRFFKTFNCNRNYDETELIMEKFESSPQQLVSRSLFDPINNDYEKAWDVFTNLKKSLPCGPKEHRLIHLKNDIKNIFFEDLNFCHTIILCNAKYIEAALQILSSNNCSKLKRLALRTCVFSGNLQNNEELNSKRLKKRRMGVQVATAHPFESVAGNLKNLTQLEISLCSSCISGSVLSAYHTITLFNNLEKLSLEISPLMDGLFLKEVFIKCDKLKSLRLKCLYQNEKFMINLGNVLKYATSLRDLRLEHINIFTDRMFEGLNAIQEKKLLRLFLKCDTLKEACMDNISLQTFMEKNRQLIFLFLVVSNITTKQKSNIQKILNSYKGGNAAKIFYVKKDLHSFSGAFPIPTAHHDIIFNRTYVSVINFDEF